MTKAIHRRATPAKIVIQPTRICPQCSNPRATFKGQICVTCHRYNFREKPTYVRKGTKFPRKIKDLGEPVKENPNLCYIQQTEAWEREVREWCANNKE